MKKPIIMNEITIHHLARRLPFGVQITYNEGSDVVVLNHLAINVGFLNMKTILHSLSDLTNSIEHNGETFVPLIKIGIPIEETHQEPDFYTLIRNLSKGEVEPKDIPYWVIELLLEWHFQLDETTDMFVDVNTLDINPYK